MKRSKKSRRSADPNISSAQNDSNKMDEEAEEELKEDLRSLEEQSKQLEAAVANLSKDLDTQDANTSNSEIVSQIHEVRKKLKTKEIEEEVYK